MSGSITVRHAFVPPQRAGLSTLLMLHGTGGDETDLLPLGRMLLPGAGMISPRGAVMENGMPRHFRRLAEGVFDLDDLQLRTADLAQFVLDAADTYSFDAQNVIAVGYSNGANIAASLLLSHPGTVRGAVLFHGMLPFEPVEQPRLAGTNVLLTGGRSDPMAPAASVVRLAALLESSGASLTTHWEAGGHAMTPSEVDAAQRWLADAASVV